MARFLATSLAVALPAKCEIMMFMGRGSQRGNKNIGGWLFRQFLTWQATQGRRKTLTDFARYLGVKRATLEKWLYGSRVPGRMHVGQIAARLGPAIYDLMGMPRPDPRLATVISAWHFLAEAEREEIARRAAECLDSIAPATEATAGRAKRTGSS